VVWSILSVGGGRQQRLVDASAAAGSGRSSPSSELGTAAPPIGDTDAARELQQSKEAQDLLRCVARGREGGREGGRAGSAMIV
jgi:hypothetical protein